MKDKGKLANTLFFLSLLCIFVVCSLLVVSYQIHGYHQILNENDRIQNQSFISSYLRNQVRFHDERGKIRIENIDGMDVLALSQEKTTTYLYVQEGYLKELYTIDGYELVLDDGEKLFKANEMKLELNGNQLRIVVDEQILLISLYSEGGDEDA